MPTCNIFGIGVLQDTYDHQGWDDLCCWKQPNITYESFLTGITDTYNNRTCLKDRLFSDYTTKLFMDCLSADTDTWVSGGTLNATTGVVTFTNTTGGTLDVSGFNGFTSYWSASTVQANSIVNSGSTSKVGIGTSTPNEELTVVGTISATTDLYINNNITAGGYMTADYYNSTVSATGFKLNGAKYIWLTSSDLQVGNTAADTDIIGTSINLQTATTVNDNLTVTGNVGIGTTAPKTKLDVHHNPTDLVDDTGGGEVVYFGTNSEGEGEECVAGKLMYLHTDGVWYPADAAVATGGSQLLGICLAGTVAAGGMLIRGFFDARTYSQGVFAKGMPCYVSEDAGKVDFTAPSESGEYVRVVGYGTDTASVIYFNPDKTWVELS